ncbi:helix-turn-helix transcriptional regulator [Catenuloplanes atrovinosus]|uniref:Transcriptional regulator with XRE-family HTH domain n=1 Tax=Catenuloplanes atrovinosus TaxID=137266 RepID=A0AAE4C8X2_9ACTN|nr:helix-turn-helix transcriptional regulator [Catenuloplanes atrovinosus]MDR7275082.1 transcriptional regulator with XRE-family HTH domain [Catenuloplanes atrovinosus]
MSGNVELREFLRSRRARLRPDDLGLPETRAGRRVPGLRREELAALAGVSVDYYVRLEQGRDLRPSDEVLDALARALRLDDAERAHLFDLAKPPVTRRRTPRRPQRIAVATYQLMETLDLAASPALLLGRRMDVLAINRTARALLGDLQALPARERNYARFVILDENARSLHAHWSTIASETVAALRLYAGRHPDDPDLSALVGELSVRSEDFRRWWADHQVLTRTSGTKHYRHPVVGEFALTYQALTLPDDAEQTLFVYTAPTGTPAHTALRLLAQWAAGSSATVDGQERIMGVRGEGGHGGGEPLAAADRG